MSDSTIIASFQNAFPGLYPSEAPPSYVSASLPASVSASVASASASAAASAAASVAAIPRAKDSGDEGQELVESEVKQPDQYSIRIQAITDQVGPCVDLGFF